MADVLVQAGAGVGVARRFRGIVSCPRFFIRLLANTVMFGVMGYRGHIVRGGW
jgi:hypothetical protein